MVCKWLDKSGISQQWLSKSSGVGRTAISNLTQGNSVHTPNAQAIKKIMKAIKKIDPNAKVDDFFDI
ncbi:helix-turn-helix domain-containing protein [Cytobacillus sp. IB215665]|uniref:helix-turn-helix domain-containing protein n=1 Tax=Cytobacillus sp. IB215665 TaxID=3097357 RepID=UPI002A112DC3|nr:helix-turn-helix domain-containing protein [Cytobacillus sp. IB215665]MDX8366800.1 helix-turn-helix domain-containing protein [Cytobacillus sp. IB215665]